MLCELRLDKKLKGREGLGNRNLMRLYMAQSWAARKLEKFKHRRISRKYVNNELKLFGMTIHFLANEGRWV